MCVYRPGEDVEVDFEGEGHWWPAEVLRVETSGYVICRAHVDPSWDFGRASSRVAPEQTVAVRSGRVRYPVKPEEVEDH